MPQLDGLRAISVLAVMYTHYLPKHYWFLSIYWGGYGVRIFFVISGFLVTQILLQKQRSGLRETNERWKILKNFYIKRFLRLAPVFYLTLLVMFFFNVPNTRETFWWHVLYLSNINFAITNSYQEYVAHFWSLAVEFQFYLVWPFVILFLSEKALLVSILATFPAVLVYRFLCLFLGVPYIATWMLPPYSLDALMLGALLAFLSSYGKISSNDLWFKICALIGIVIGAFGEYIFGPSKILMHMAPTLCSIFFSWIVLRAVEGTGGPSWQMLQSKALTNIGKISYGVYLFHFSLFYLLYPKLSTLFPESNSWIDIGIAITIMLITLILAGISWNYFEKPINQYRRHF